MIRLPGEGDAFGRYRLDRVLGRGGMGVVHAAHDTRLGRDVAIKLVAPQFADDSGFRERFQQEAATLARLDSPHVVSIFDHGEQDGVLFIVTQLVPGGDLSQRLGREGALAPELAISLMAQVARGLADAHAVGVVHRDIKPANVLLRGSGSDVEALLCDFGIATAPGAELSRTGSVTGSLPYMAPERHQGRRAGVAGDIYALGCLFWHLLTGSAPYAGSEVEVAMGHIQGPIPQLPGRDDFSSTANKLLRRAMAKDPAKRHPSARAMLQDLTALAAIAPESVALPGATVFRQALVVEKRRRWVPAVIAGVATAVVLAGGAGLAAALQAGPFSPGEDPAVDVALATAPSSSTALSHVVAKAVNEAPVLVPDDSDQRPPDWDADDEADPGTTLDGTEPSRSVEQDGDRTAHESKPKPAPRPTHRCWNGAAADSCSAPVGWRGATWIFQGMGGAPFSCHPDDLEWTAQEIEAWECNFGAGNWVYLSRWSSTPAAVSALQSHLGAQAKDWRPTGGASWGHIMSNFGSRYYQARVYSAEPWAMQFSVSSVDALSDGTRRSGPWRDPAHLRGVPNS